MTPQQFAQAFSTAEKAIGAPAGFLLAIAVKESAFNPATGQYRNVRNTRTGAAGLMQLTPVSLKEIQQKTGKRIDPMNPAQAIEGAANLLQIQKAYIQKTTGTRPSWAALTVAYNQGWTAGRKYSQTKQIGPKETRLYLAYMQNVFGDKLNQVA